MNIASLFSLPAYIAAKLDHIQAARAAGVTPVDVSLGEYHKYAVKDKANVVFNVFIWGAICLLVKMLLSLLTEP